MPDVNTELSPPAAAATSQAADDPLAHLPKMSTTAGAGSQEYVAINVASVVALLLGCASVLAMLDNVLLVVPLAAVVVALVALRQVDHSNGTQTGRGIALGGLALAVAIGFFKIATAGVETMRTASDKKAIAALCEEFGVYVRDRKFDDAYGLFSERFKARVSKEQFVEKFKSMQDWLSSSPASPGPISGAHWNGLVEFHTDANSGAKTADASVKFSFGKTSAEELHMANLRKSLDRWTFENMPDEFPTKKQQMGT